jgi:hypothetical protein
MAILQVAPLAMYEYRLREHDVEQWAEIRAWILRSRMPAVAIHHLGEIKDPSTPKELCAWMDDLSKRMGTGIRHRVDETGNIVWFKLDREGREVLV